MELLIKEINLKYKDFLVMFTEYKELYHLRLFLKPYRVNSQPLEDYTVNRKESVKTIIRSLKETIVRYQKHLK